MKRVFAFLLLVVPALVGNAQAQTAENMLLLPARSVGMAGFGRSAPAGPSAILLNPAGLVLTRQYEIGATYTFAGGEPDSHAMTLSWTDSQPNAFNLAGGLLYNYQYLGSEADHNFHGALAYGIVSPAVTFAIGLGAHLLSRPGDGKSYTSGDAGLGLDISNMLKIGAVGYNLVSTDSEGSQRGVGGGISYWGGPVMIGVDISASFDEKTATGEDETVVTWYGGFQYMIMNDAYFRAGVQYNGTHEITRVGGGLQMVLGGMLGVELGYMQNIDKGDDMIISATLDFYNPFGAGQNDMRGFD